MTEEKTKLPTWVRMQVGEILVYETKTKNVTGLCIGARFSGHTIHKNGKIGGEKCLGVELHIDPFPNGKPFWTKPFPSVENF